VFSADDADEANFLASRYAAKGDVVAFNGTTVAALAVGTNDYVLTADSAESTGLKWGQIAAAGIASNAVTTAKIQDNAVTQAKLADRVVGSAEYDNMTLNAQTGTTYTLVLTDAHKFVTLSNASAITLTVPPNSSVAFETGDQVNLMQLGAGQVTVSPGAGVTIRSAGSKLKTSAQYAVATLLKIDTDTWVAVGSLSA